MKQFRSAMTTKRFAVIYKLTIISEKLLIKSFVKGLIEHWRMITYYDKKKRFSH